MRALLAADNGAGRRRGRGEGTQNHRTVQGKDEDAQQPAVEPAWLPFVQSTDTITITDTQMKSVDH